MLCQHFCEVRPWRGRKGRDLYAEGSKVVTAPARRCEDLDRNTCDASWKSQPPQKAVVTLCPAPRPVPTVGFYTSPATTSLVLPECARRPLPHSPLLVVPLESRRVSWAHPQSHSKDSITQSNVEAPTDGSLGRWNPPIYITFLLSSDHAPLLPTSTKGRVCQDAPVGVGGRSCVGERAPAFLSSSWPRERHPLVSVPAVVL